MARLPLACKEKDRLYMMLFWDYPKFCVTAKSGANRVKFIMGGRRVIGCRLINNITPAGWDVKGNETIDIPL